MHVPRGFNTPSFFPPFTDPGYNLQYIVTRSYGDGYGEGLGDDFGGNWYARETYDGMSVYGGEPDRANQKSDVGVLGSHSHDPGAPNKHSDSTDCPRVCDAGILPSSPPNWLGSSQILLPPPVVAFRRARSCCVSGNRTESSIMDAHRVLAWRNASPRHGLALWPERDVELQECGRRRYGLGTWAAAAAGSGENGARRKLDVDDPEYAEEV
ncbi:uncharacterized protein BXZ73DRAFT_75063 [Epithele typhae]|uniref:uncharacterized protein n=1 Tax=Epithele typhae TaxID=378194 RepID=UPI00200810AF|nr:uncharacterized protein BXZ73DRAFT_75063 [Epithele typhae]KAH9941902.1 hypothetical protein BXZ73DRAFT_75063 [Epithele typhae]